MSVYVNHNLKCVKRIVQRNLFHTNSIMAKSKFEYVKSFELDEKLLPNCWIVVRVDGKGFHKFCDKHCFTKPNDKRALSLMNRAAGRVLEEYRDIAMAYGQSDEYSFVFRKETEIYKRRHSKIMTYVNSLFTSSFVYHWQEYFSDVRLRYPPVFDARIVLYPNDRNLIDYISWRQADVHINNLYNTTFWTLVQSGGLTNSEAEKRLCGTDSSDKNEILFSEFQINYNNEDIMFRKGTVLLRKRLKHPTKGIYCQIILPLHEDMISETFWNTHNELLSNQPSPEYKWPEGLLLSELVLKQFARHTKEHHSFEITEKNH